MPEAEAPLSFKPPPPGRMVSIRRHFLIPWLGAGPGQADAHAFTLSAPAAGWLSG